MAWEQRGKRMYYYQKKRQGHRVVSEYVGHGSLATLIAELDREEREDYLHAHAEVRAQKSGFKELEVELEDLTTIVRALVHATLLTSGYHPHKGQWRKKRYG